MGLASEDIFELDFSEINEWTTYDSINCRA